MRHVATLAVAALVGLPLPAGAVIVDATYTGVIHAGFDQTGIFGVAGADLTGLAYTSHYRFDTGLGTIVSTPTQITLYGGPVFGLTSPMLSSDVTINGIKYTIAGEYRAYVTVHDFLFFRSLDHSAESLTTDGSLVTETLLQDGISNRVPRIRLPFSIDAPFSYTEELRDDRGASGRLFIRAYYTNIGINTLYTVAQFDAQTVTVTVGAPPPPPPPPPPPGVPEPASWAMLIAGFGLVGAAARRARVTASRAI